VPKTIQGPGLFISQFVGGEPPFNTLGGIAGWAAELGFKALQIPISDPRLIDLGGLSERDTVATIETMLAATGLTVSEISAQRAGQLLVVHPAYNDVMDALALPAARGNPQARLEQAKHDLRRAISRAAAFGARRVVTFSGGLAWPFFYPYPPHPAGLVARAFDELGGPKFSMIRARCCFSTWTISVSSTGITNGYPRFMSRTPSSLSARAAVSMVVMPIGSIAAAGFAASVMDKSISAGFSIVSRATAMTDGVAGLSFVAACLESSARDGAVVALHL
jgi:hypothetical protein